MLKDEVHVVGADYKSQEPGLSNLKKKRKELSHIPTADIFIYDISTHGTE
jgi:hypothetical protein